MFQKKKKKIIKSTSMYIDTNTITIYILVFIVSVQIYEHSIIYIVDGVDKTPGLNKKKYYKIRKLI